MKFIDILKLYGIFLTSILTIFDHLLDNSVIFPRILSIFLGIHNSISFLFVFSGSDVIFQSGNELSFASNNIIFGATPSHWNNNDRGKKIETARNAIDLNSIRDISNIVFEKKGQWITKWQQNCTNKHIAGI